MARLSAAVDATVNDYQSLPRQRHISASTQEFKYAQYMLAWVAKVERVGNLNYPEAARRNNLSGRLILDVALNPDGSIKAIEFVKSSGHDALDDAAVQREGRRHFEVEVATDRRQQLAAQGRRRRRGRRG